MTDTLPGLSLRLIQFTSHVISVLVRAFLHLTQPTRRSIVLSAASDLTRRKTELRIENALLRQQLIALRVHPQVLALKWGMGTRSQGVNTLDKSKTGQRAEMVTRKLREQGAEGLIVYGFKFRTVHDRECSFR